MKNDSVGSNNCEQLSFDFVELDFCINDEQASNEDSSTIELDQKMFNSNKEADVFLEELGSVKKDVGNQTSFDKKDKQSTQISFNQYAKKWFYDEHSHEVTASTFKVRKVLLEKHIAPYFGDMYLHEITGKEVIGLYTQKKLEGYSDGTIMGIQNLLATLFHSVVKKGYLDRHPMNAIKKIIAPNRTPVILNETEIKRLLETASKEGEGMLYEFALSTGLRLVEILALSWRDINFEKQTIDVEKIVNSGGYGNHKIVNMRSGYRRVIMPSHLLSKLKKHKAEQIHSELDLVFPNKDGGIQKTSTVRGRFNRLIDKANISRITFHDLRKTHAALLVKAGVSPVVVKYHMGYKSIETIINFLGPQFLDPKITLHPFVNNEKDNN